MEKIGTHLQAFLVPLNKYGGTFQTHGFGREVLTIRSDKIKLRDREQL